MVVGHVLIGLAFIFVPLAQTDSAGAGAWLALLAMVVFCAFYATGLGNVPWCIVRRRERGRTLIAAQQAEIFSTEVRSIGNGMATAVNWLCNLCVSPKSMARGRAHPTGSLFLRQKRGSDIGPAWRRARSSI